MTGIRRNTIRAIVPLAALGALALPCGAQEVDAEAAMALARKGSCMKCHAIEKRKKAPSYHEIAESYRNKPNAQTILIKHITGNPVVKLEDGDEEHTAPPTKDDKELVNLVRWILSR